MSTQSHLPARVVAQVLCYLYHFFVFCVYCCRRWWSKTLTMVDSVWPALTNVLDSVCMHGGEWCHVMSSLSDLLRAF